ncbi:MAG: hypothetical protein IK086_02060 [Clostridia bacterium]|nr:hypothetical protein [Clostridia bacterium]
MADKNYSIIISTCDKFSDLWEANITLLEKNWGDRGVDTYLVTDKPTERRFDNVTVIAAGEGKEITERLAAAIEFIKTDYVVFLLDDYFLPDKVDAKKIDYCMNAMAKENFDYLRLYTFINAKYFKEKVAGYEDIYHVTTDARYNINLYPCGFSVKFLRETLKGETRNAWQYEVSLTKIGDSFGAKCALTNPNALNMLDVVRKGRIIRKAKRYLDKHDLYHGDRPVLDIFTTLKLGTIYKLKIILPRKLVNFIRRVLKKCGKKFYSDEYEN